MARKIHRKNIILPEELSEINPENVSLLEAFKNYLISVQRSTGTISSYEGDLKIAFIWNLRFNDNKVFTKWTKRNIIDLQNWMIQTNKNSPARVRRQKASLSAFSKYIENVLDDEYPGFKNIVNKIESPPLTPVMKKTILSEEKVETLLNHLTKTGQYDKACALALAAYSGRRKTELLRFKVSDFDDNHLILNGALYKSTPIKTKGRGVQGKMLECFTLAKKFKPYFDNWMKYREENNILSEWLFPSTNNYMRSIKKYTLDFWTYQFSDFLGEDFYWHALRHMTVTSFKRAGIPDTIIKLYIGWDTLDMVCVYSDLEASEELSLYFDGESENGIKENKPKSTEELFT